WNGAGASRWTLPELRPRAAIQALDLARLAGISLAEYSERFRGSAMKRATWHGLRRNAAIALGNLLEGAALGDVERARAHGALRAAAADADASVAAAARWALDRSTKERGSSTR